MRSLLTKKREQRVVEAPDIRIMCGDMELSCRSMLNMQDVGGLKMLYLGRASIHIVKHLSLIRERDIQPSERRMSRQQSGQLLYPLELVAIIRSIYPETLKELREISRREGVPQGATYEPIATTFRHLLL